MTVLSYYCPWCNALSDLTSITPDIEKKQNEPMLCVCCLEVCELKNHTLIKSSREIFIEKKGKESYHNAFNAAKYHQSTIDQVCYITPEPENKKE